MRLLKNFGMFQKIGNSFISESILILLLLVVFVNLAKGQTADFTMSASSGCTPITITFVDKSTDATTWWWDFGNSNIDKDETVGGHTTSANYGKPGTYTVTRIMFQNPTRWANRKLWEAWYLYSDSYHQ